MAMLGLVTLVVLNYDAAIEFYVGTLGFSLIEDKPMPHGKRWVVVRPKGSLETGLLLAQAKNEAEISRVGNQTGGRVALFLETDNIIEDYAKFSAAGVIFNESLRHEAYGSVAVFQDLYGNLWDLIQRR